MKRLSTLALVGMLLACSPGLAQIDPDPDSFGIYFDTAGTVTEVWTAAPFSPVSAYLVVTRPTSASIAGWECRVDIVGMPVAQSWSYAGGGLNVYDAIATGLFNVGVGMDPRALVPVNNVCVLATWSAFIMTPLDVVTFTVYPFPNSVTFFDSPGYVDGHDIGIVVPCGVSTGYPYGNVCAVINGQGVIGDEDRSWGDVKALYR